MNTKNRIPKIANNKVRPQVRFNINKNRKSKLMIWNSCIETIFSTIFFTIIFHWLCSFLDKNLLFTLILTGTNSYFKKFFYSFEFVKKKHVEKCQVKTKSDFYRNQIFIFLIFNFFSKWTWFKKQLQNTKHVTRNRQ